MYESTVRSETKEKKEEKNFYERRAGNNAIDDCKKKEKKKLLEMGRRSNVHELKLRQNWVETADDNECV